MTAGPLWNPAEISAAPAYAPDPRVAALDPAALAELNAATRAALATMEATDPPPRESGGVKDGVKDGVVDGGRPPPTPCPRPVHVRPVYQHGHIPVVGAVAALRCNTWDCDSCGPRRRVEVLRHIRLGAGEVSRDKPLRFLTVTFATDVGATFDRPGVANVNERFRRFVQAMRREHVQIEYAKTLETTKRGRLHVHALARGSYIPKCDYRGRVRHGLDGKSGACYCAGSGLVCHLPKCPDARRHNRPCIQSVAWSMGLGFIKVQKVHSPQEAAGYMAKYLTKASAGVHHGRPWPKYARRYSASRRWAHVTLGQIHAAYIARLRVLGIVPEPDPNVVGWMRADDPATIRAAARPGIGRPPPEPAGAILDRRTGELLPVPF